MKRGLEAVLLAAGYGTRLGDLGRRTPKGLLPLPGDGRPVLTWLLEELEEIGAVSRVTIVTNMRFHEPIRRWAEEAEGRTALPLHLVCDGTRVPEERLGAVGDLALALAGGFRGAELLVLATDTAYLFPLRAFVEEGRRRPRADLFVALVEEPAEQAPIRGVATVDGWGRVTRFDEKPDAATPVSEKDRCDTVPPLYLFRPAALALVEIYLAEGGDPDAPGHLVEWLVDRVRVEAWKAPAGRIDLGLPGRGPGD